MAINPYVPTSPASTVPEAAPTLAFEAKTDIDNPPRSFVSPDIHQDHSSVYINDEQRTIKKKKKQYSQKKESGGREGTTSASTTESEPLFVQVYDPKQPCKAVRLVSNQLMGDNLTQDPRPTGLASALSAVHVSDRLIGDNLTHNPSPPVTVITDQSSLISSAPGFIGRRNYGQSSIACTTAPDSWLDTVPMSRSLPSTTCNTVSSISEKDSILKPRISRRRCYGIVPHCRSESCTDESVSGWSDTVNKEYYTFTTCSSGGQSYHPNPQIVNEFSQRISPKHLKHGHGAILLIDLAAGAEASSKIEEATLSPEYHMFATCSSGGQSHDPTPQIVDEFSLEYYKEGAILLPGLAAGVKASPKIEETKAEASPKIEETTLPPEPTNRSPHFTKAERAGVPFLHHTILECDHHSQEYTIHDHDITLRIPEGAVPTGEKIQFEIAVAMYGPFKFEKDMQPISPIIWLCFDEGVTLNKPFHVILPHFLTGLTYEKAQYHQVVFAKASHSKYSIEEKYSFQSCDSEPYFASSDGRNFGVLVTNHTCFYCLQARKTPELVTDAGYWLARIDCFNERHMEVTFTAVYCIRTCLKAMEEQFPCEKGYRITEYKDFKFKENTEPHVRVVPTYDCDKLIVALNPAAAKIKARDIDFQKDFETMQLQHKNKVYPPRVKMTVGTKNRDAYDQDNLLSVKIEGCSEEDQLDIELLFPPCTLPSSASSSASVSQGECQSPKIKVQERPELKDVFRELLPLSADWKAIGTLLGLPRDLLKRIKADEEIAEDRLQEVLSEWLKQVDPHPTWAALAKAVEHVDKVKAQEIKTKYIDIDLQ